MITPAEQPLQIRKQENPNKIQRKDRSEKETEEKNLKHCSLKQYKI